MTTKTEDRIQKWTLDLGKVDANGRGRKVNRVTLDIELRHKTNDVAPYLDVDLNECREYAELSICGNVWNAAGTDISSGGQCTETIGKLFPGNATVQRLVEIWGRYHLNGMKSGTRLQEAYLRDNPVTDRLNYYDAACKALEKANLLTVTGGEPVKNGLGQYVPRNYKYGTAWLVERLPVDVEAEVVRICGELTGAPAAQVAEPKGFAEENGITAEVLPCPKNPNLTEKHEGQRHFFVTFRKGGSRDVLTTYFSQGSAHTKPPTALDVLGSLALDASSVDNAKDFTEWASELGFDADSRKAEKTYETCKRLARGLKEFLGTGLYRALLEDING